MTRLETLGKLLFRGLVPAVLPDELPAMDCLQLMDALDMEAVEISAHRPQALELLTQAKRRYPHMAVGISALLDDGPLRNHIVASGASVPTLAEVVDAGADFMVSMLPFREQTYERYRDTHVLVPVVTTLGEGYQALEWGANLLKIVNPQIYGGPNYFRALDAMTYHTFPFFTMGAGRFEILPGYIAAGVLVCGVGFDLILGPDYHPMQCAFDEEYVQEGLEKFLRPIERSRRQYMENVPFASKDPHAIMQASGRFLNV